MPLLRPGAGRCTGLPGLRRAAGAAPQAGYPEPDPAQHYISNLAGAAAPYRYSGCVRRGILSTKYQGKPWRAVEMGNRLVQLALAEN